MNTNTTPKFLLALPIMWAGIGLVLTGVNAATTVKKAAKPAAKPATKPAVKPAAKPKPKLIHEVLGTEEWTGWEGSLGETFTLGKDTPYNFTLKQADYTVSRSNVGGYSRFPKGDEKLLVLHFTIQNPRKTAFNFTSSSIDFKAVDSAGVTRNYVGDVAREGTGESLNIELQPGQKIEAFTAIPVAAFGEAPKLLVRHQYESKAPIIRYDLRGKVSKLVAPFVAPDDTKGANATRVVPGVIGVFYPVTDLFDIRVDSISYSEEPLAGREPDKGKQYCFAKVTIRNGFTAPKRFGYSYFRADLKDMDDEKTDYTVSLLKNSRDEEAGTELQPNEEAKARFYWQIPKGVEAKTVLLQYGYDRESRTYAVNVEQ